MHVEDMDFWSYPTKAVRSPDGSPYLAPQPATNIWKVNYLNSDGEIRHEFYKAELSSPVAEIPADEIRVIEKRMIKPEKIVGVFFGLLYIQKEPGGEWVKASPNDKDPRADKFYEGDYTRLYMEQWRKRAYETEFDTLKLTRAYSKEDKTRLDLEAKARELEETKKKLEIERANTAMLKSELTKAKK